MSGVKIGRIAGVAAVAALSGLGGLAWRRRQEVLEVAPELRTPALYLPLALYHPALIGLAQRVRVMTDVVEGVTCERRLIPAGPGASGASVASGASAGDEVPVFLYDTPERAAAVAAGGDPTGAVLWIHGGGHVMGEASMDHDLASRLAAELAVPVVSVEYRLAPAHPFPADVDDCFAALEWLRAQGASLGVDPERIAVAGASAGGGIAASVVQRAVDEGITPCFQLLVYPMLDDRTVTRRDHDGRGRFAWTLASNKVAWAAYLGHPAGEPEDRPYAVPARRESLAGMPPTWIGVGDLDLFVEEDLEYARRLRGAGVPCEVHLEPGMPHGADITSDEAASMRAFRQRFIDAMRPALTAG